MSNLVFKPQISAIRAQTQQPQAEGRRELIVDPRFQYGVLAWMAFMALVVSGVIYAAHQYFFHQYEQRGLEAGLAADHVFFRLIQEQRADMDVIFVIVSLACIAFLTFFGAVLSHRVAGPIAKVRKHMDAVARGETVQDLSFRRNDCFPELAESFNKVLAPIRAARKKSGSRTMKPRSSSSSVTMRLG